MYIKKSTMYREFQREAQGYFENAMITGGNVKNVKINSNILYTVYSQLRKSHLLPKGLFTSPTL